MMAKNLIKLDDITLDVKKPWISFSYKVTNTITL